MKRKILVAEDEKEIRSTILRTLELCDYDTLSAENGKEALELAKKYIPDLIISDIMMPEVDGYGLLTELQKDETTVSIPLLFLSAKSDKSDIREGMNLGADDYLTKPFDIDDLIEAVEIRLKKKDTNALKINEKFDDLRKNIRRALPHEIRTPMNSILGFTEFMIKNKAKVSEDDAQDMLKSIYESAQRLNSLFEKYLLYATIEIIASNPKELQKLSEMRTPSPESLLSNLATYKASKWERESDLQIDLEDAVLKISEEYFMKIFDELFENAMKYSEKGSPIKLLSQVKDNSYEFSITDEGRGMNNEQVLSLGAFVQFERKIYEQQGTGLGLALVKRLADLHGGKVYIRSEPKCYTTVTVSFQIDKDALSFRV